MSLDAHIGHITHLPYSPGSPEQKIPLRAQAVAKRVFDLLVSGGALLCVSPFLLLVACIIKYESPGPALFRQVRNGRSGKTFQILKFRTMRFEPTAAFRQCAPSDRRVMPFGSFLRKTSIDELPQLINVLRGDMSLVGPRPHPVELDSQFAGIIPNYMDRYAVRPGLTGWAQVLGRRGPTPTPDVMTMRLAADLEYIKRWSLSFDLLIFSRTIPALLFPGKVC